VNCGDLWNQRFFWISVSSFHNQFARKIPWPLCVGLGGACFLKYLSSYNVFFIVFFCFRSLFFVWNPKVLRYVGVVDAESQQGLVELRRYKKDHPFAQLAGSDNIIAFTTTRYKKQPLIVRGPGAGAQVTAGGIFSDILLLASYLGAPS